MVENKSDSGSERHTPGASQQVLKETLLKLAGLCARSEQAPSDIVRKLRLKGMADSDIALIISELEKRKFLDSSRFARSFANDKVKFSGWGRVKIKAALMQKKIPACDIAAALDELDSETYGSVLLNAARARARKFDVNVYSERIKIIRYLLSRGFTSEESMRAVEIIKREDGE
ncbi:MAG: RecX family transcriptional regulator [Bacteroidales bacterium]|nr:RecX family transcriptional regulator [Bacteroidales bacterium]MBD5205542.1 RecX family transcriptional regulator [Bacteroidales bacterium]MBD5223377.1 RecX family transcriptional regulator [Bacteroidales bacterium]MBD5302680.1 RecX family transcriptional regulator [Bacteroides sp.]MBD5347659.1 RecX family transcriptional regulator [Bacteroides sp.]